MPSSNQPTFDFSGDTPAVPASTPYNPTTTTAPGQDVIADQPDRGGYKGVHPIAAGFHVAFKIGAILTYILGGVFSANYVVKFVVTVLFCAADFWVTKNITGRILVALRWWNEVKEDGSTEWVFESAPEGEDRVNAYDNWFFWSTSAAYCLIWLVLCVFNLLSISSLPILIVGLLLSGANLLGYVKCRRDAKSRFAQFMVSSAANNPGVVSAAASAMTGGGGGGGGNASI